MFLVNKVLDHPQHVEKELGSRIIETLPGRVDAGNALARTAPWLLAAIGTKPCNSGLDIPGSTRPLQVNYFVHFALNANPDGAGNAGATEATVPARVLCEVLLVVVCLGQVEGWQWREGSRPHDIVDNLQGWQGWQGWQCWQGWQGWQSLPGLPCMSGSAN